MQEKTTYKVTVNEKEEKKNETTRRRGVSFLEFVMGSVLRRWQRLILQLSDLHMNMEERAALKL